MKTFLVHLWDSYRSGFWFIPSLLIIFALIVALAMPHIDYLLGKDIEQHLSLIVSTAPAARLSLSSIAGALITMTGVVFSITLVALTSTASQFGSRLVRNMMDDRMTQISLGALMATSLYCLLVVRTVYDSEESTFVPHLSVALGLIFAVVSVGLFVGFIHHVGQRLQAPNLVNSVALVLDDAVDRLFPETLCEGEHDPQSSVEDYLKTMSSSFQDVNANRSGYLQGVDGDTLMNLATEHDLVLWIPARPGSFIATGRKLIRVWPSKELEQQVLDSLNDCFIIGAVRTPRQDVECVINELVEIAVRALSPGINDPFTAMTCLDYLGVNLAQFATRKFPSPIRKDQKNNLRILTDSVSFRAVMEGSFSMILHHARREPLVLEKILTIFESIQELIHEKGRCQTVLSFLDRAREVCETELTTCHDRRLVEQCSNLRERFELRTKNQAEA